MNPLQGDYYILDMKLKSYPIDLVLGKEWGAFAFLVMPGYVKSNNYYCPFALLKGVVKKRDDDTLPPYCRLLPSDLQTLLTEAEPVGIALLRDDPLWKSIDYRDPNFTRDRFLEMISERGRFYHAEQQRIKKLWVEACETSKGHFKGHSYWVIGYDEETDGLIMVRKSCHIYHASRRFFSIDKQTLIDFFHES